MKKFKAALTGLLVSLFLTGCADVLTGPPPPEPPQTTEGKGLLVISLAGVNVGAARTLLPEDPRFTRYELVYSSSSLTISNKVISFYNSTLQLSLAAATDYELTVWGYDEDTLVAKSDTQSNITILPGSINAADFILKPYMDETANPIPGVLNFSLAWDGLSRMPYRAELLIETYADAIGVLVDPPAPIDHALIPPEFPPGSVSGSIRLLDRESASVNLSGSLTLPPGEYRLTMSVMMDPDTAPASRLDYAHVYSNLTTPAPFYYGGGDLYISNTSPDSGASFITGFTFEETPNATTVIGSEPGLDGTRMIMIMVPSVEKDNTTSTNLAKLTPVVTTAAGSVITSPVPVTKPTATTPNPDYTQGEIDFTGPTIWTAQAKNGAVQTYTVVVSMVPEGEQDKSIVYFFFEGYADYPGIIDQNATPNPTIKVILPYVDENADSTGDIDLTTTTLTPVISIIGQKVTKENGNSVGADTFNTEKKFKVYAKKDSSDTPKEYAVTVTVAQSNEAEITRFAIDGYPDRAVTGTTDSVTGFGTIAGTPDSDGYYPITLRLPYGVSLKNLTPLIQYKGTTLSPVSGLSQNFSGPIDYTVTPETGDPKTYRVIVTNDAPDKNTGIFDFRVTNVPAAKVVIGQKPRQDGRIPIVIQVPHGTDETNMIAAITLSSPTSRIDPLPGKINFGSGGNYQEAVYTVYSQGDAAKQDYVVVVSEGPEYYYVDGVNGRDDWPDVYNGGSESHPFKTLAYAVGKAGDSTNNISKIFIKGDLTAATEGGTGDSAFTLDLSTATNKTLTITSTAGATLRGTSGKRVLKISGGADITFENISVSGGNAANANTDAGKGGGVYITGDHNKVKFSGGSITGNTAYSGGGVFIEDNTAGNGSEFTFMGGEISGNTATGAASGSTDATLSGMGGGGGVYVKGDALFWLASGTISGNSTSGAGGGVLVNKVDGVTPTGSFFMSGGKIVNNKSTSSTYPHGGGGVYVAQGAFNMLGGEITGNTANRQGGGVFVHWGDAKFVADGNSTITGNTGVGSSAAICNRGTTELLGSARADKVYIWDYEGASPAQEFTLVPSVQVGGVALAYSASNKNYITLVDDPGWTGGTGQICIIDLESHLNSAGSFAGQLEPDWLGKKVVHGNNTTLTTAGFIERLPLNSFTGTPSAYNLGTHYKIEVTGTEGLFKKK